MDELFLAFVDYEGRTQEGKYIYRFDFTIDSETAWGDYFNISPSIIVPDIVLDKNCITLFFKCIFPCEMILAKTNSCFSMQDCIDGILPLCFCDLSNKSFFRNRPIAFNFGEEIEDVRERISDYKLTIFGEETITPNSDILNNLIDNLGEYGGEEE